MHSGADLCIKSHSTRIHVTQAELPVSVNPEEITRIFKILLAQSFQAAIPSPHTELYPGKEIWLLQHYPWMELLAHSLLGTKFLCISIEVARPRQLSRRGGRDM